LSGNLEVQVAHYRRDNYTTFGCRKSTNAHTLHLTSTSLIVEDDLKARGIARARLATLFDTHPTITHVEVVDFTKKIEKETLKNGDVIDKIVIVDDKIIANRKKIAEKEVHWSSLEPISLSTIPKKKIVFEASEKRKYKIVKIKKLIGSSESDCSWSEVDEKVLTNKKPKLYVTLSNRSVIWKNNTKITTPELFKIVTILNQIVKISDPKLKVAFEVFGVLPSYLNKLEDHWQPFYGIAEKVHTKYKTLLPMQFGSDYAVTRKFGNYIATILTSDNFIKKLSEKSLLLKYIKASHDINDAALKIGFYNDLTDYFGQAWIKATSENQKELQALYEEVATTYPLLLTVGHSYAVTSIEEDIHLYIDLKDRGTNNSS